MQGKWQQPFYQSGRHLSSEKQYIIKMFWKCSVTLYIKQETNQDEDSEEDEVEDEEEEDEIENEDYDEDVVKEESKNDSATEKNEPKAHEGKANEHVSTAEKDTKMNQEETTAINKVENEQPKIAATGVNSSENDMGKTTFLEKTKRLSLFKRKSTTSQRSLQGNGNVAAVSHENTAEKSRSKESKDGNQNIKPENPRVTEPQNEEATGSGQNAQDRKSKSATCLLLWVLSGKLGHNTNLMDKLLALLSCGTKISGEPWTM